MTIWATGKRTVQKWLRTFWILAFIIYPLEIGAFALWYSRLPLGSFAQMTAQMDPSYLEQLRNAEERLALDLKSSIGLGARLREIAKRTNLSDAYEIRVRLNPATGPGYTNFAAAITIYKKGEPYGGDMYFRLTGAPDERTGVTIFRDCNDCPNETVLVPEGAVEVGVEPDTYNLLVQVSLQQRNWLIRGRTFFNRFLYFSAVTSTTVGYGDIVPLTDLARVACALQAFTSIILFGLLVNSLWVVVGPPVKQ